MTGCIRSLGKLHAESHRAQYWGLCCSLSMSMIWFLLLIVNCFFMLMILRWWFRIGTLRSFRNASVWNWKLWTTGWSTTNCCCIWERPSQYCLDRSVNLRSTRSWTSKCGNSQIMPKSEIKYLGLDIHQSLDGEITANKVIKKANSRLKFLQRKGRYLNVYTKNLLVSALIQCHYDYAGSSWYLGLTKHTKQRLQITQKQNY